MNKDREAEILKTVDDSIRMEMKTFSDYLQKKGLKITSQRMLVAERIFSLHNHFTAESLLEEFKDQRDKISKATIYRILSIMVEAKLLQEHNFGQDYKYYEHIIGHTHHDHIICIDCGRIVEFVDERIEQLQEQAAASNGFKITGHSLNIYGSCLDPNCSNKK
ncbi:Fur family transcriptional regulator [Leptospira sarikeiensis]|uniref:Ferric uptake regulation protein n=1 Tax=Leptospira sarikeiensis TaxID=2484943 RepID=A0A4R9KC67_9LEPT|nr:Fur family transcriptional regulator [Leptospira sarikeiensis]TGL64523.1 transcriptional repressor [Leptospira sarikeiensis]